MIDRKQINSFLQVLYTPSDEVELVAVKDGNARRKTFAVADLPIDGIQKFEDDGWNVYISALPLYQQQNAKRYDRIWIDMDEGLPLDNFDLAQPTTLVQTSKGRWQAIWLLDESDYLTIENGKAEVRRLALKLGGDPAVNDPRRVLRLPGVQNAKRGEPSILRVAKHRTTSLATFKLPEVAANGVTIEALMGAVVNDPKAVLGEWFAGCDEGDRARKAYVTARFLKNCGVTYEDALILVNTGAQRATPVLSENEVVHATQSAFNRQD